MFTVSKRMSCYKKVLFRKQGTKRTGCRECILKEIKEEKFYKITIYREKAPSQETKKDDLCRSCKVSRLVKKLPKNQEKGMQRMFQYARKGQVPLLEVKTVEEFTKETEESTKYRKLNEKNYHSSRLIGQENFAMAIGLDPAGHEEQLRDRMSELEERIRAIEEQIRGPMNEQNTMEDLSPEEILETIHQAGLAEGEMLDFHTLEEKEKQEIQKMVNAVMKGIEKSLGEDLCKTLDVYPAGNTTE